MKLTDLLKPLAPLLLLGTAIAQDHSGRLYGLNLKESISNECCDLTYKDINDLNLKVRPLLKDLVADEDYFKHLQFQLDMSCPFFECQSICFSPGCQLDLDVHSDDYNYDLLNTKGEKLSDISGDSFLDSLCPPENQVIDANDDEWCDLDDKDGVIIDISRNPERFTGYIPPPEQNIWSLIYQHQLEGECPIEQKVFYQIISGFHSSVSTHLSNEYYNNVSKSWEPNLELFNFKVGDHPERIQNIYFNYALLVRSILRLSPYLKDYKFNPQNPAKNRYVYNQVKEVIDELPNDKTIFNEDLMFKSHDIKEEFRSKFKNVTKLMDCVTCDRCRLWGKIQSTGYATALKILFTDRPDQLSDLSRNEILSLFNTFDRLTKSVESVNNFNHLNVLKEQQLKEQQLKNQAILEQSELEGDKVDTDEFDEGLSKLDKTFSDHLEQELLAWKEGFRFVISSYINLPHNLKTYFLYKMNQWWNTFIGINKADNSVEYLHNIIA